MRGKTLYYVEDETEKNLINCLKNNFIISGKVEKLDLWEEEISSYRIRVITANNIIVIFDTDKHNHTSLKYNNFICNINELKKNKNLEDEIVKSKNINRIEEFYGSENIQKLKLNLLKIKIY